MHADLSLVAKQNIWHGFVWGGDVTAQSCMQEATMMRTGSGVLSQGEDSSQGQTGISHHATSSYTAVQLFVPYCAWSPARPGPLCGN